MDGGDRSMTEEVTRKILVIGNGLVGKTAFVSRVTEGKFIGDYKQTVGVDYAIKKVHRPNNLIVSLALWDLAGQSPFKSLMPVYARHASGIIVMCCVENRESFDAVADWKKQVDSILMVRRPSILLVNKFDLPKSSHTVTIEEISELSQNHGFNRWYQTSVKENVNLEAALVDMADLVMECNDADRDEEAIVSIGKEYAPEGTGCC